MPLTTTRLAALAGLVLLLGACADDSSESSATYGVAPSTLRVLEGSPDGVGVLRMLNDEFTTFERLDVEAGLDRRAAAHLIAYRDGANNRFENGGGDDNLFTSVEEVDAVRWVGPSAINKLINFALIYDFVPGGNQFLGTYDGVDFTVNEADLTLDWVNQASAEQLREIGVYARAVATIFAARPLQTVYALQNVRWVGRGTMWRLKNAAMQEVTGQACRDRSECPGSLYCVGKPHTAEVQYGRCRDLSNVEGAEEECHQEGDCLPGLFCSGLTVYGSEGYCRPLWMQTTVESRSSGGIPAADEPTAHSVFIFGQASVPEDIIVEANIEFSDPRSLWIALSDPNGTISILWDGEGDELPRRFLALNGISRDDQVNGKWSLLLHNRSAEATGTLNGWKLTVSSRFD